MPEEALRHLAEEPNAPRRRRTVLWTTIVLAVVVGALVVVLVSRTPGASRPVPSPLVGRIAPTVEATTIDGERFELASLRGRWVVVNFFATWCVPCREEHPELVRFERNHRPRGDAAVVGVIYNDSAEAVREFRGEHGGTWPMLVDPEGSTGLAFGIRGVPETFLVAPDGTVVTRLLGGVTASGLDSLLAEAGS